MLFLYNDVVFNLGAPQQRLTAARCPISPHGLSVMNNGQLLQIVREATFADPAFAKNQPDKAMAVAAMVLIKTGANAVLAVRLPTTRRAEEVPVRLADVSLRVLGDLFGLSQVGKLTPGAIDRAVWRSSDAA